MHCIAMGTFTPHSSLCRVETLLTLSELHKDGEHFVRQIWPQTKVRSAPRTKSRHTRWQFKECKTEFANKPLQHRPTANRKQDLEIDRTFRGLQCIAMLL